MRAPNIEAGEPMLAIRREKLDRFRERLANERRCANIDAMSPQQRRAYFKTMGLTLTPLEPLED